MYGDCNTSTYRKPNAYSGHHPIRPDDILLRRFDHVDGPWRHGLPLEYRCNNSYHYGFCYRHLYGDRHIGARLYSSICFDERNGEPNTNDRDYPIWFHDVL